MDSSNNEQQVNDGPDPAAGLSSGAHGSGLHCNFTAPSSPAISNEEKYWQQYADYHGLECAFEDICEQIQSKRDELVNIKEEGEKIVELKRKEIQHLSSILSKAQTELDSNSLEKPNELDNLYKEVVVIMKEKFMLTQSCFKNDEHIIMTEKKIKHLENDIKVDTSNYMEEELRIKEKILKLREELKDTHKKINEQDAIPLLPIPEELENNIESTGSSRMIQFLNKAIEEKRADLKTLVKCPACSEIVRPPVFMCQQRHIVCLICRPQMDNCPVCRLPYSSPDLRHNYAEKTFYELFHLKRERRVLLQAVSTVTQQLGYISNGKVKQHFFKQEYDSWMLESEPDNILCNIQFMKWELDDLKRDGESKRKQIKKLLIVLSKARDEQKKYLVENEKLDEELANFHEKIRIIVEQKFRLNFSRFINNEQVMMVDEKIKQLKECVEVHMGNVKEVEERIDKELVQMEIKREDVSREWDEVIDQPIIENPENSSTGRPRMNQFLDRVIKEKEDELKCRLCSEMCQAPIFMCQAMHLVCSICRPKIEDCPVCGLAYSSPDHRHWYAENTASELERLKREKRELDFEVSMSCKQATEKMPCE